MGWLLKKKLQSENKGWFNTETQRKSGQKGAAVNKKQGTGAWDPKNLEKANQTLKDNNLLNTPERLAALKQGMATQKEKGINVYDPVSQRRRSVSYRGLTLNGVWYSADPEQRTYVCETTLEYYLRYAEKTRTPKKIN